MSDKSVIRFQHVFKEYPRPGIAPAGVKALLLDLPGHIKSRRKIETSLALTDVSFEVAAGEAVGIIGRNGAGKSTLLKLVAKIIRPTRGVVDVDAQSCPLLDLQAGLQPELSGVENIILSGVLLGFTRREVMQRMGAIIDFSELGAAVVDPVRSYSSGMVARLAFAVASHIDARIILIDEVLAVGDAGFQRKCLARLRERISQGATVVLVSHQMAAIRDICERAILLDDGVVRFVGPVEEAIARHQRQFQEVPRPGAPGAPVVSVRSAGVPLGGQAECLEGA